MVLVDGALLLLSFQFVNKSSVQGWIYPVSHRSLRCKIEVLRCEIECDSQKIAMQSDFDRAKIMLFECDFRACMNACTCGLCSSVRRAIKDLRLYAISFYLSVSCLCAGHSILATFHVCHTHVVFLIFECAVLITSCKLRLTAWDVGSSKYFWQVIWVVEVDVERRGG